jgi:type II secretory pathway component GspD/PulD (secretin)
VPTLFESRFAAAVLGAAGPIPTPSATTPQPAPAVERERMVYQSMCPADPKGPFVVDQTPAAPAPRPLPVVTAAYRLRNAAAADAATAVRQHLAGTRCDVTVAGVTNELVVRGSPAAHARVAALVGEIDRTPPQVVVTMLIATVPTGFLRDCGLTRDGDVCCSLSEREVELFNVALRACPGRQVLSRPQVQVTDNQTGYVQVGQELPAGVVRPVVYSPALPGPRLAITVDPTPVGVSARVTPRVLPDGKTLLRVETQVSTPTPPAAVAAGAAFPINIQTTQTTAVVPAGHALVVSVPTTGDDGKPAAMLFVVKPNVVCTEQP